MNACFYYQLKNNTLGTIASGAYTTEEQAVANKNKALEVYRDQNNYQMISVWINTKVLPLKRGDAYIDGLFGGTLREHGKNDGLIPEF